MTFLELQNRCMDRLNLFFVGVLGTVGFRRSAKAKQVNGYDRVRGFKSFA